MPAEPEPTTLSQLVSAKDRIQQAEPPTKPHPLDADDEQLLRSARKPISSLQIAITVVGTLGSSAIVGIAAALQQGSLPAGLAVAPIAGLILSPLWFTLTRQDYKGRFAFFSGGPRTPSNADHATAQHTQPVVDSGVAARAAVRPDSPAAGSEQSSFLLWSVGFENRNLQSSRHYTPVDGIIVVIAGILAMGIILAGPILAQVIIIFWA